MGGLSPAEIVISDLVVHGADLALVRDAKGRWNFDAPPRSRAAGPTAPPHPRTDRSSS